MRFRFRVLIRGEVASDVTVDLAAGVDPFLGGVSDHQFRIVADADAGGVPWLVEISEVSGPGGGALRFGTDTDRMAQPMSRHGGPTVDMAGDGDEVAAMFLLGPGEHRHVEGEGLRAAREARRRALPGWGGSWRYPRRSAP